MNKFILCLVAFALSLPAALAQQVENESDQPEVVVTATRIATPLRDTIATTEVITAQEIERTKPRDLGTLLSRKSGLSFRDSGGKGSRGGIFVRGTDEKHLLVLIDGMRTASATLGLTAIERIPLEIIERIEIVKGPMSSVYGADAVGGVIQIFTKKPHQAGTYGSVKTSVGSNRERKYTAQAGFGEDQVSMFVSATKESTDGIDRTKYKGGGNEDKDGFKRSSGNLSLTTFLQDDLELNLTHFRSVSVLDYDNISTSSSESRGREHKGRNWHQRFELSTTSARIDYDHSSDLNFSAIIGTATDNRQDLKPDHPTNDSRRTHFKTRKSDYSLQANWIASSRDQVSVGAEYQQDKVDSTDTYANDERTNKGYFALWQHQRERSATVANVRHERNDTYASETNYNIQQSFDISDTYQIAANYGTAFQAPSLNELFYEEDFFRGDPDLKPEESKSTEVSLRSQHDDLHWKLSLYHTTIENLIVWKGFPSSPVNVDEVTLKGVEIELTKEWNDNIFNFSGDYLEAYDDKTGNFLDDRARGSASIELGRQIGKIFVGANAFYEHSRFDRGSNLGNYAIYGINAEYKFSDNLIISGHIDNLFDKDYTTNLASDDNPYKNEGRTFEISMEYRF